MLAILGCFLLITAAVDHAGSTPHTDQSSAGSLGYKLLENRLDQLELKLQSRLDEQKSFINNTNTLLEKIVNSLNVIQQQTSQVAVITSCNEATTTRIYQLRLSKRAIPVEVLCDMDVEGGGWLVMQQRFDGSVDFNRSWSEYRDGFGVVDPSSEFWLGLETLHRLTWRAGYELLVQLRNESGHDGYARYEQFQVAGENKRYSLSYGETYHGTIGEMLSSSAEERFSTYDRDNDKWEDGSCAQTFGGGWWFYQCSYTALNGPFKKDINTGRGILWNGWTDAATYSRMLIRRR